MLAGAGSTNTDYGMCIGRSCRRGNGSLEIEFRRGNLLSSIDPAFGVGVDFSQGMVTRARCNHPGLQFLLLDAHFLDIRENFQFIILSDLVNDLWNVQAVFHRIEKIASPATRIVVNFASRLWGPLLAVAESTGHSRPQF